MGDVTCPAAHPCLAEGKDFAPEEILAPSPEEGSVCALVVLFSHSGLCLDEVDNEVAGDVIGAFVCLVLVGDAYALWHALLNLEVVGFGFADNSTAVADGTGLLDRLSFAVTLVAVYLHLLE